MPPACCAGYRRIDSLLSILTQYGRKQGNGGTRTLRNSIPGYDFEPSRQQDGSFFLVASSRLQGFQSLPPPCLPRISLTPLASQLPVLTFPTCNPNPTIPGILRMP